MSLGLQWGYPTLHHAGARAVQLAHRAPAERPDCVDCRCPYTWGLEASPAEIPGASQELPRSPGQARVMSEWGSFACLPAGSKVGGRGPALQQFKIQLRTVNCRGDRRSDH